MHLWVSFQLIIQIALLSLEEIPAVSQIIFLGTVWKPSLLINNFYQVKHWQSYSSQLTTPWNINFLAFPEVAETVFCCFVTHKWPYFQHKSLRFRIELCSIYTLRSRREGASFISSLSLLGVMYSERRQIMPGPPPPHPRMLRFPDTTPLPPAWQQCLPSRGILLLQHAQKTCGSEAWGRRGEIQFQGEQGQMAAAEPEGYGTTGATPPHHNMCPCRACWTQPCPAVGSAVGQHQQVW